MNPITILKKEGIRNDSYWVWLFRTPLKYVPLCLDVWALRKSEQWSADERAAYHAARRVAAVQDAARLPYWQRWLGNSTAVGLERIEQWELQPVTTKQSFLSCPESDYVDAQLIPLSISDHTSGSTGQPFNFYFDRSAELRSFAVTEHMVREATQRKRFPLVYLRSRYRQGFTPFRHLQFFIRGYSSVKVRLEALRDVVARYSTGFILYGYTSTVIEVVRQLREQRMQLPFAAIMATGESLSEAARAEIESETGVPFRMVYASRETGWLGYECEHKAMHVNEAWAYIEIVDDKGRSVGLEKEGRIVVTTFDNRVQPFIRYELGDRGVWVDAHCACGRKSRILRVKGRTSEILSFNDGARASLLELLAVLDAYAAAVRRFQIIRSDERVFTIRVVPGEVFDFQKDALRLQLLTQLPPHSSIVWEVVTEIEERSSGKAAYYCDTRPL